MKNTIKGGLLLLSGLAIGLSAATGIAQEVILEEITVTATKRQQTLQEVPVAVSVIGGETIDNAQMRDVFDLQSSVPSLRVWSLQSAGNTTFAIRGFGNGANNVGIEPAVGIFIDGVYRSRSAAAISDLPNVERIEVLRGPQSTLFGKNASAGVISVITALPADELSGSIEARAGNYNSLILKGEVSIPLSENTGVGISAGTNTSDGYFDNLATGNEIGERDRFNLRAQLATSPTDSVSLRFIADYDEIEENCCPVGNILAGPTAAVISAIGGSLVPNDPFAYENTWNTDTINKIENSGISMQADIDFENSTLTSITSVRSVDRFETIDPDFTSAELLDGLISNTDIDTFTQELRLAGTAGDNVDWLVGVFYFDESVRYDSEAIYGDDIRLYVDLLAGQLAGLPPGTPGTLDGLETNLEVFYGPSTGLTAADDPFFAAGTGAVEFQGQEDEALSIFTQFDFHLGDRTTITLGANYTQAEKDAFARQINTDVFSALDFVFIGEQLIFAGLEAADPGNPANGPTATFLSTVPCDAMNPPPACNQLLGFQQVQVLPTFLNYPNVVETGNSDDSETTWTARIAFDINDSVNVYASAGTGFKATSWNLSRDARPFASDLAAIQAAGIAPPNLTTGTRFAGPEESTVYELGLKAKLDRLALNVALFDQTIEGFQSNLFGGLGFNLTNAGEQSTTGVEIDATWFATDALQLTFAGTFMDPNYDSFVGGLGPGTDLSGQTPASIHETSIVASATYNWEMGNGIEAFVRGEYQYEDEIQVVDNIPESIAAREMNVINASFGVSTPGGWDIILWGRNITDDEFLLSAFPATFQDGTVNGYPSPPATYGLTLRKHFD